MIEKSQLTSKELKVISNIFYFHPYLGEMTQFD